MSLLAAPTAYASGIYARVTFRLAQVREYM